MTVIIGYVDSETNSVYLGGDSRVSQNTTAYTMKEQKVFQNGEFLIGGGGKLRMLNILKYQFDPPSHPKNMPVEKYINSLFTNSIQKLFNQLEFIKIDDDNKAKFDGVILVGYRGHLFQIDCEYGVFEDVKPYQCIGTGSEIAMGVLETNKNTQHMSIKDKIMQALSIAGDNDNSVGPPYYILKV